jgi:Outer membrane protein beta-barrel domain
MSFSRNLLGALALSAVMAAPALAQNHAVWFAAKSGGFNAVTNLDAAGTTDFKRVGYNLGGAIGVDLQRYVAIRADFSFARNQLRSTGTLTGDRLNRFFYDAAVQLQYPTSAGVEPYVFAGGGAITLHEVGTSGQNKTKATGTAGLGVSYTIPGTNVGIFAEGQGWVYKLKDLGGSLAGYDKTQVEITWGGGVSYRLPF